MCDRLSTKFYLKLKVSCLATIFSQIIYRNVKRQTVINIQYNGILKTNL